MDELTNMSSWKKTYALLSERYPSPDSAIDACRALEIPVNDMLSLEGELVYKGETTQEISDEFIRYYCLHSVTDYIELRRTKGALLNLLKVADVSRKYWFVTVNFDDSRFDEFTEADVLNRYVAKLINISGFNNIKYVVEKHRIDGIHRHIHMLLYTDYRKSKIVQYIYQKVKGHVIGPQFIDVKNDAPYEVYLRYISGDKQSSKLECVEADVRWRQQKNIMSM